MQNEARRYSKMKKSRNWFREMLSQIIEAVEGAAAESCNFGAFAAAKSLKSPSHLIGIK